MEKLKNYRVLVEQVDRFSYEFTVPASSESEAKGIVEKMIEEEPLDCRKNTYDSTDVSVNLVESPIPVHTVESLFDIDKDVSDEEVILLDDLSDRQKILLGLLLEDSPFQESQRTFIVLSSAGTLKVDSQNGLVLDCMTERNAENELRQIEKFDLEEYRRHHAVTDMPGHVDILDLGYWNKDGVYEKPVEDWRNTIKRAE